MLNVKYVIYRNNGDILYSQQIKMDGGSAILCRDEEDVYPILSEITTFDIERFYPNEMKDLINELLKLKRTLTREFELDYVEDIINICQKCQKRNKGEVVFNPFTDKVKIGIKQNKKEA